jgi:hypothetical protein
MSYSTLEAILSPLSRQGAKRTFGSGGHVVPALELLNGDLADNILLELFRPGHLGP